MKKLQLTILSFLLASSSFAQVDCSGVDGGTALIDDCGDCQQAYLYNFITHVVTFVDDADTVTPGPNELLVYPDSPLNPYWNQNCTDIPGCTDPMACNFSFLANLDDGSCEYESCVDCADVMNGSALTDDCGVCQQAYLYNVITHEVNFVDIADDAVPGMNEIVVLPDDPTNPLWNASCTDCNGIPNGPALVDDCGSCQQAYLYNFITHMVTLLDLVDGVVPGPNENIILPDDPTNPLWNGDCTDCAGILNGSALLDDCGVCQQAYLYDFITHEVTYVDIADEAVPGPTENLILPDDAANPLWNASCTDCNGVTGGSALVDDCGVCQLAYLYNVITHEINYVDNADEATPGMNEIIVLPNDPTNPLWNGSCADCNNIPGGSAMMDDCDVCQQAYLYNFITHEVTFVDNANDVTPGPNENIVLPNDPTNPYWNSSCVDCAGIIDGSALEDNCGVCHQAYLYNFITHEVTFVDIADEAIPGVNEFVVLPDDFANPYWNDCEGCTDPAYLEFDPTATQDNGSCATLIVEGCLYPSALNYDPIANVDDMSCEFNDTECPADLNNDLVVNAADLLAFLGAFGNTCE